MKKTLAFAVATVVAMSSVAVAASDRNPVTGRAVSKSEPARDAVTGRAASDNGGSTSANGRQ